MSQSTDICRLAISLAQFYPECVDEFMCPTCLARIPVTEPEKISVAHIIPEAAGGRLKTYLCRDCNSKFGTSQDKWFGEYLNLRGSGKSILETRAQRGAFKIDGERVGGTFGVGRTGGIEFRVYEDRTSPRAIEKLRDVSRARHITVSVPVPLLRNAALIDVGFLTAGYLLWFRSLGYAWALQEHLDCVREQILNPGLRSLGTFIATCPDENYTHPTIGCGFLGDEFALMMRLSDQVVLLPPADNPDLYARLDGLSVNRMQAYSGLRFAEAHTYPPPCGIVYDDRIIVVPDAVLRGSVPRVFVYVPRGGGHARILRESPAGGPDPLHGVDEAQVKRIDARVREPRKETGRPEGRR